ncbi:MAG: hypothetical protein RRZ64_08540 [Rikenellaceae bacterium]
MYTLSSDVRIGGKRFKSVAEVEIKRSLSELMSTAKIKTPTTAVLKQKDTQATIVEVAQQIKVGDKVEIRLGYDGKNNIEFRGYVKQINLRTPLEIECEDEFYKCRKRKINTSGTTTLKALLHKMDLSIGFAEDLKLKNFVIADKSIAYVLSKLQGDYGLTVFFDLNSNIYAMRKARIYGDVVNYEFRRNVINDDDLQYLNNEDVKLEIKAICYKKDGTVVQASIGTAGGTSKTLYFYDIEDMSELKVMAENEMQRLSVDGYSGNITTFLLPNIEPCCLAEIKDNIYPQRNGLYYVEGVKTKYGRNGGRRIIEIGQRYDRGSGDKKTI